MEQNELLEIINSRRSIREFTEVKITKEQTEALVEAGLRAPSSKNSQPWYIVAFSEEEKTKMCDYILENPDNLPFELPKIKGAQKTKSPLNSVKATIEIVRKAPLLLLIFNRKPFTANLDDIKLTDNYQKMLYDGELVGIGACMENILLAAKSMGLGSVALMDLYIANNLLKKRMNTEDEFIVGIAIGHPAYNPPKRKIEPEKFSRFV